MTALSLKCAASCISIWAQGGRSGKWQPSLSPSVSTSFHSHAFLLPQAVFCDALNALQSLDQCASSCANSVARGAGSGKCQLALRYASVDRPGRPLAHMSCAPFVPEDHWIIPGAVPASRADWTGNVQPYRQPTKLSTGHGLNLPERTLSFGVKTSERNSRKEAGVGVLTI